MSDIDDLDIFFGEDYWAPPRHGMSYTAVNKLFHKGGRMRQRYEGGGRSREKKVEIKVFWASGEVDSFICKEPATIQQRYKQLNFIEHTGEAVAINLHQTKYVKVDDENIDFNDIAQT
jgi:hypothetical protein